VWLLDVDKDDEDKELRDDDGDRARCEQVDSTGSDILKLKAAGSWKPPVGKYERELDSAQGEYGDEGVEEQAFSRSARRQACEQYRPDMVCLSQDRQKSRKQSIVDVVVVVVVSDDDVLFCPKTMFRGECVLYVRRRDEIGYQGRTLMVTYEQCGK
jgi:hypothetical protein